MSDTPNNPPAYPNHNWPENIMNSGMTLRDYFAAKAMQSMLPQYLSDNKTGIGAEHLYYNLPVHAYKMADAMLKERAKS